MALIEVYHVVADQYEVDPDFSSDIVEGMLVRITTSNGRAVVAPANTSSVLGVAGDTQSETQAGTPYAADLVIGSTGSVGTPSAQTRSSQNRVSDMFNETLASGKITVYTGGGTFKTDQIASGITITPGEKLFSDANGKFTDTSAGDAVAMATSWAQEEPSGVPGTATPDGSLALGTFVTFKLLL